jgi:lipid-A-disaccharide synthase
VATILLTCGETSGEHHAARLVTEMRRLDPSCRVLALGGSELAKAGAEIVFPLERYAVMGFLEVFARLPRFISLERSIARLLSSGAVDLFIPVDYPGLNLRLAGRARSSGVPVLYFISPQVWAWGGWRVRRMKSSVNLMAVILPFEAPIYEKAGIPVMACAHPMLDEIAAPSSPKEAPGAGDLFTVLLFPGSRKQEFERMFPVLLGAARVLRERFPRAEFLVGLAPLIEDCTGRIPGDMRSYVRSTRAGIEGLESASLVLATSGTVTLQSALSGTPTVVLYRTSPVTYALGRLLVRIPWIAMPNVLAGEKIIPELIQGDATPKRLAEEAASLLGDGERYRRTSAALIALRGKLCAPRGVPDLADVALKMARSGAAARGAVPAGGADARRRARSGRGYDASGP